MEKWRFLAIYLLLLCLPLMCPCWDEEFDAQTEEWGYVEVRPKAHMFWWLYKSPYKALYPSQPWPTILWLSGGPGVSGAGVGNFLEFGPLDANLRPRNLSWLRVADLLFVESPVGVGFSYVEDQSLLVRSDDEATADLLTLLKHLYNENQSRQRSPLYIVGESYGGKLAVSLALSILQATDSNQLNLTLGGAVLGSTWNLPEDYAASWGQLLRDVSRLDANSFDYANRKAEEIKQELANGLYINATDSYLTFQAELKKYANFYNFVYDNGSDPLNLAIPDLGSLMNGVVRQKLNIIAQNLTWTYVAIPVFNAYKNDFMKPRIAEVDELLAKGVNVTIFSGQFDVVCAFIGTDTWLRKLKWGGLEAFIAKDRTPMHCGGDKATVGYTKSHQNLNFYWILGAGHYVPSDQPCASLAMAGAITQSPAASM